MRNPNSDGDCGLINQLGPSQPEEETGLREERKHERSQLPALPPCGTEEN